MTNSTRLYQHIADGPRVGDIAICWRADSAPAVLDIDDARVQVVLTYSPDVTDERLEHTMWAVNWAGWKAPLAALIVTPTAAEGLHAWSGPGRYILRDAPVHATARINGIELVEWLTELST